MWSRFKQWVNQLKRDVLALWLACRDKRTHWAVRLLGILIVAYALSPIDLIPDFIPIIGFLDELILLPAGLWILVRFIPAPLLSECRDKANRLLSSGKEKPSSMLGAAIVILIWLVVGFWLLRLSGLAFVR